jgi:glucose/arabinose dehydrogenase
MPEGSMHFRLLSTALAGALAASSSAQTALTTARVCSGLSQPLALAHAPGDASRLFVVERTGRIKVVNLADGTVNATPFLDVSSRIATAWLEYGLLGLAFHPDYAHNGVFYVNYTPPNGAIADTAVVQYRVSANPNVADPASATPVLRFGYGTRREHRAGWMGFGPDGYLYITTGDGGENDPDNAAQNLTMLRGKVLRLDVNGPDGVPATGDEDGFPADANRNYRIPADNPFAGDPVNAQEIWAYGLRNPWRASFDRQTGDLWIGDVGQNTREEIDFQPAGAHGGRNYGWRCTEGTFCTGLSGCTCNGPTLTRPVFEYPHGTGLCVTGGYVYRGCAIPDFRGTYLYADYQVSKVFSFRYNGSTISEARERTAELAPGGGLTLQSIAALGEDDDGELYFCDYNGGEVFKLIARSTPPPSLTITRQPAASTYLCDIHTATLTVDAASFAPPVAYQWFYSPYPDWPAEPLTDQVGVEGSTTPTLTTWWWGTFFCRVSDGCGSIDSDPAYVSGRFCAAEYNCDGFIDFFDYLDFVRDFESGAPRADINGDGFLDFFDYDDYVTSFESSC